jgi:hypothetical protein
MAIYGAKTTWLTLTHGLELQTAERISTFGTGDLIDLSLANGSRKLLVVKRPEEDGAIVIVDERSVSLEREAPVRFRLCADWRDLLAHPELMSGEKSVRGLRT